MNVLVVEDDNISRLVLMTKLKKLGYPANEAIDGEEGWSAFTTQQPGLVITDWMMPRLDGLCLTRRIREQHSERYTYIIMLTALQGKKNCLEGMDAGVDDFLNKPVDMDELSARLRVADRILAMQKEISQLEGLLPICSYCKKIRNESNAWEAIEGYISKKTDATFSHGFCPRCYEVHVKPQLTQLRDRRLSPEQERSETI